MRVRASNLNYHDFVVVMGGIPTPDGRIPMSDGACEVVAVGEGVTKWKVGDAIVTHPGHWNVDDPWVLEGDDPMLAPSANIWGYNINFGSFGQFCVAQEHQVMEKAKHLTWQ